MLSLSLALGSALLYGLSDFVGGLASRRASPWKIATVTQVTDVVLIGAAAWLLPSGPTMADLGWGALAGIGTGAGTAFLYRGLAAGRMSVVAPLSAVGAALVPLAVGVATGDRPAMLTWLGIACALPAVWLLSSAAGPSQAGARKWAGGGVVDGILAGLGFGLVFSALGQVPDTAGLTPLVVTEVTSIAVVAAIAAAMSEAWLPRERESAWGILVGALGAMGVVAFLFASQAGMLAVAAVLASLYPVVTVLLAATVLRERVHGAQAIGLGLACVAIALVATG